MADVLKLVKLEDVQSLFHASAANRVKTGWPHVAAALRAKTMAENKEMIAYALGTIRAETGRFTPDSERPSTASEGRDGRPFGAYDQVALKTDGKPNIRVDGQGHLRLTQSSGGNRPHVKGTWLDPDKSGENQFRDLKGMPRREAPDTEDGELFRGRGYVQLTGRKNYEDVAKALGLPLVEHPELASEPAEAARILAWYIARHQNRILQQLHKDPPNYLEARAAVNGKNPNGTVNGLDDFTDAYDAAIEKIDARLKPKPAAAVSASSAR